MSSRISGEYCLGGKAEILLYENKPTLFWTRFKERYETIQQDVWKTGPKNK